MRNMVLALLTLAACATDGEPEDIIPSCSDIGMPPDASCVGWTTGECIWEGVKCTLPPAVPNAVEEPETLPQMGTTTPQDPSVNLPKTPQPGCPLLPPCSFMGCDGTQATPLECETETQCLCTPDVGGPRRCRPD